MTSPNQKGYTSSQRVTSLLSHVFTFLQSTGPKKQVLDFPLLQEVKEKPTRPVSVPPTLLPTALWLVQCLLVAADVLTDQGSADVTKGSVCFEMLPTSEVPGDVTKMQCQDHEPLKKHV